MNKAELIDRISKDAELGNKKAGAVLDAIIAQIIKTVGRGEDVVLVGFGTFKLAKRAARTGRNPRNGEALKIPASKTVKFSVGKAFKEAVNKGKR